MGLGRAIKKLIKAIIPPCLFIGLTAYFSWNAIQGEHGIKSYQNQLKLLEKAKQARKDALSEQQAWAKRIKGLKENGLDKDILDERARAMLSLANSNDLVIPYSQNDHLF
ncbi:FtsB family cell division protein [Entomobacter blattae]|uniref:Septation inhibitor protein n=1 Tax=Entomobacter blattae TaxID=2762277 RepID=A0A7H1NSE8_9PROT|nr:septum formation initiator family protein [Entomobacter blattae]QNT78708.1 hypothetical protein JGUZn3_14850 [Entomobacter blattae]